MKAPSVVIISGLSGSGKSNAIKCFEDAGFFCIDNLPPVLLPTFVELCAQTEMEIKKAAVGIDIRERDFLDELFSVIDRLKSEGYPVHVLYLEARDEVLVNRFSETRRPHPLADNQPVVEGIRLEKEKLRELRQRADVVIDTSRFTIHDLKRHLTEKYSREGEKRQLRLSVVSFGYKYGIPYEADLLFDVRFLQNPNFLHELKPLSGDHPRVQEFIMSHPEAKSLVKKLYSFLDFLIPLFKREGRSYLTMGIGCTGGKHRSVTIGIALSEHLRKRGYDVSLRHRDIDR